jgi:hypothetical protein
MTYDCMSYFGTVSGIYELVAATSLISLEFITSIEPRLRSFSRCFLNDVVAAFWDRGLCCGLFPLLHTWFPYPIGASINRPIGTTKKTVLPPWPVL